MLREYIECAVPLIYGSLLTLMYYFNTEYYPWAKDGGGIGIKVVTYFAIEPLSLNYGSMFRVRG